MLQLHLNPVHFDNHTIKPWENVIDQDGRGLPSPVPAIDGIDIDLFQPDAVEKQDDLEELQAIYDAANTEGTVSLDCLATRQDAMATQLQ